MLSHRTWRNQNGTEQEASSLLNCFDSVGRCSAGCKGKMSSTVLHSCQPNEYATSYTKVIGITDHYLIDIKAPYEKETHA